MDTPDRPVGPDKSLNGASPRTRARLFREGMWAKGKVVAAGGTAAPGASADSGGSVPLAGFVVEYRYAVAGIPHWGACVFLRTHRLRPGEPIDVWYDPADPDINVWPGAPGGAPGDWLRDAVTGWRLILPLIVVILGAAFIGSDGSGAALAAAFLGSLALLLGITAWDFMGHWELAAAIDAAYRRSFESQPAEPPANRDRRTRRERRQGRARHRRR